MNTDELKQLPPAEKKVVAKVLMEQGYSSLTLESWLGISDSTVLRAAQSPVPEQLKEFEEEFKAKVAKAKKRGAVLALNRMLEIIPKYDRLDHLVKASEYFEGIKSGTQVNVQNNAEGDMSVKVVEYDPNNAQ